MEKQLLEAFLKLLVNINAKFLVYLRAIRECDEKPQETTISINMNAYADQLYGALALIVTIMGNDASNFTLSKSVKTYLTDEVHPRLLERLMGFIINKREDFDNTAVQISQLSIWPDKVKPMFY